MFWEAKRSTSWNHLFVYAWKGKKIYWFPILPGECSLTSDLAASVHTYRLDVRYGSGHHRVCRYVHVKKTNMQGSKNIWLKKWAECSVCQEIIKSWKSKHLYDVTQLQYNTSALRSASLRTSRFRCLGLFVSTGCVLSLHPVVAIRRMAYFVSLHSHIWKSRNHGDTSQNTANQLNDTMGKNNHRGALSTAVFPTRRLQFHWMPRYINGRPIVFCNQF